MRSEQGFSLVEIIIALLVFTMVVIGTITVIGAATAGGFLDAFPTSFATTRAARDFTAGGTYLQSFQEFVANQGFAAATAGAYCVEGPGAGSGCSPAAAPPWTGYPTPTTAGYQLNWDKLEVIVEQWYWDDTADTDGTGVDKGKTYCPPPAGDFGSGASAGCSATATGESVKLVRSTLTWLFKTETSTLCLGDQTATPERSGRCLTVKRFLRSP